MFYVIIITINDLPLNTLYAYITLFADNTNITFNINNKNNLQGQK